ncbi:MAG: hypothetical protein ACYSO4_00425 [Planctomycetota bacterium]
MANLPYSGEILSSLSGHFKDTPDTFVDEAEHRRRRTLTGFFS